MEIKTIIRDAMWENYNSSTIEDCNINQDLWNVEELLKDSEVQPSVFHKFYANYIIDAILESRSNIA